MEILLTGNTGYITEEFIDSAFPDNHVIVNGSCSIKKEKNNVRLIHTSDLELDNDVLDIYEFDQIVFFSNYLTYHGKKSGELEELRKVLQYCRGRETRLIYLSCPMAGYSDKTGKNILAASAENLCHHYRESGGVNLKIIRIPFLYSSIYRDDFIYRIFNEADKNHRIIFTESNQQPAVFLSSGDLAELLFRVFDSWDMDDSILCVPDVFSVTFRQLGADIQKFFPDAELTFANNSKTEYFQPDDKVIRKRYGWFPKVSILTDMEDLYEGYIANRDSKTLPIEKIRTWLQNHSKLQKLIEVLFFFIFTEIINYVAGDSVRFRFIDIRLLYVVIIGTTHGMNMGILAAALASISLVFAYISEGIGPEALLYEHTNWVPFILYFVVGAICGYVQMKNKNTISFLRKENAVIREKFTFLNSLYHDATQEKRDLKRQILGSKDSFGKIYDITRSLDSVRPQEIFRKTLHVMENILENRSVSIYSIGTNQSFARLETASREIVDTVPKSLRIADYSPALESINAGNIWVNKQLSPSYPMYMVGIKRNERLVLLIMVQSVEFTQANLYYQNLLKILCGLVETTLLRAFSYQEALYDEQHIKNSIFMKEAFFKEKLELYRSMHEEKIADYTLVKLNPINMTLDEAEEALKTKTRENDTAGLFENGYLYLILHQTSPAQAAIAIKRLESIGFGCEIIPQDVSI